MLKLLKIKKQTKLVNSEEIIKEVQEMESSYDEKLSQIKLFISVDQLEILKEIDEDRQIQAKMYLISKEDKAVDAAVYDEFEDIFAKSYLKLGNENRQCPHCRREYASPPTEVKKCLGCSNGFFQTKRPQDGLNVLVREEDREIMKMQWENIKKAELIEGVDLNKLEMFRAHLEQKNSKRYTLYDAHFLFMRNYASKALTSGRFRLYCSLMYYMAEHDRYIKEFAKALTHYFYIYFLQLNGASNSVVFGDRVVPSEHVTRRILNLLKMAKLQTTQCKDIFSYSIEKLTAFDFENLPYSIDEAYIHLLRCFEKEEGREAVENVKVERAKTKFFGLKI